MKFSIVGLTLGLAASATASQLVGTAVTTADPLQTWTSTALGGVATVSAPYASNSTTNSTTSATKTKSSTSTLTATTSKSSVATSGAEALERPAMALVAVLALGLSLV